MTGGWFSPGTQVSSTNKTDRHDIAEILLKVALNTINLKPRPNHVITCENLTSLQCSSCKEYFQGNPVNNHQCYRQMTLEKEYCLDPSTQNDCNQNPGPLMQGRTVFYAVHPRYLNVDIRITIDVLKGGNYFGVTIEHLGVGVVL